jgi:hypothetical protein
MRWTAGFVTVILLCLVSADSRGMPVIRRGTPAWRAGFAAAATEVRTSPLRRDGKIALTIYGFSKARTPFARCAALFEVKHVPRAGLPVWPMPRGVRLGSTAGLEYKSGWIERCLRDRTK